MPCVKFIDLFAGIGGIRKGLEQAVSSLGYDSECVFTSEIKPYAINVLRQNHPGERISGDITLVHAEDIPDFDILCAGFPCQAFSAAGGRKGFADEARGTLFFDVARVLREKKPKGFILENVEGLANHDGGRTLKIIIRTLQQLGYHVNYRILDASDFGVPQARRRIYIVGSFVGKVDLTGFPVQKATLGDVLETGLPVSHSIFVKMLLDKYPISELYGKSIKDKRGGSNNIHSWQIGIKGAITDEEQQLMNLIVTERRKKKWAAEWGIDWMDGMPLSRDMIATFYHGADLDNLLKSLVRKRYLVREHPKVKIWKVSETGSRYSIRKQDDTKPLGYNIVTGKLSFEVNKILNPNDVAPTLVATDMDKLYVADNGGLRRLSLREGLRLFGYPDDYKFDVSLKEGYDLLGNTVVVPVIRNVATRLLRTIYIN